MTNGVGTAALLLFLFASPMPAQESPPFPVPEAYANLFGGVTTRPMAEARALIPVDRVTVERTTGYRSLPYDRFSFGRDGTATLEWLEGSDTPGRYQGRMPFTRFQMLSFSLERIGVEDMEAVYDRPTMSDARTTTLTIEYADGQTRRLIDRGGQAPPELWLFFEAVLRTRDRIAWSPFD